MLPEYITLDEVCTQLKEHFATDAGWAGVPAPAPNIPMTIHASYPYAAAFKTALPMYTEEEVIAGNGYKDKEEDKSDDEEEIEERVKPVNSWYSRRLHAEITIWRTDQGIQKFTVHRLQDSLDMQLTTLRVSGIWSLLAERKAQRKLRRSISAEQYAGYVMTGMFSEQSRRSGIIYLFRRLRPTLALTFRQDKLYLLCGLCSHTIGYYDNSFAGALVPTDDLISHLLLMRADEHRFWRISNQHAPWERAVAI